MLRRCRVHLSVTGIFPLYLDPPNLDHCAVFRHILSDPTLDLDKLVLMPLSHQAVSLHKSLHLAAMAGLALREFEPPLDLSCQSIESSSATTTAATSSQIAASAPAAGFVAAAEDDLQQTRDSFISVIGVDTAVMRDGTIVAPTGTIGGRRPKPIRVEVNFQALEMHEDKLSVIEQLIREENVIATNNAAKKGKTGTTSVTLFQWLENVETGGCLADRLWPRIANHCPNLPLTLLVPTGPMYPPVGDNHTEAIIARAAGRWLGPVSVLNVHRDWSSGYVRRRLFEEEGKCNTLVSGPILRYIDSHNLYRDERRQRQRYVAAVSENAIRFPLVSLDGDVGTSTTGLYGLEAPSSGPSIGSSRFLDDARTEAVDQPVFPMPESGTHRALSQMSSHWVSYAGSIPKLELHFDPRNSLARHIYDQLKAFQVRPGEQPDLIVPIGGDGYLMKCVRQFWMRFIPFFGVNAGHVGFLLNDAGLLEEFFSAPLRLYQVSMLYCVAENLYPTNGNGNNHHNKKCGTLESSRRDSSGGDVEGDAIGAGVSDHISSMQQQNRVESMLDNSELPCKQNDGLVRAFAFNDAWLERATGQTARFRICVNNVERSRQVRGDGVLVSTPAGSTAYAQALGGSPMPIDTPILQLVGSNCTWPVRWRPVHLPEDVHIELESCDTEKRPCRAYVDSVDLGLTKRMTIRASRVACVQLAFSRSSDVQSKLYKMQFPSSA